MRVVGGRDSTAALYLGFELTSLGSRLRVSIRPCDLVGIFELSSGKGLASQDAIAVLEDYPLEPAWKRLRTVDLVQVGIGFQEGLLGRVLGQVEIAEDRVRVTHSHVLEPLDQRSESIQVSRLGLFQSVSQMFHVAQDW